MRLKLYRAASVAEAMARARAELGAEALILGTRPVTGGVELTAALEPAETGTIDPAPDPARLALLSFHGVPPALREPLGRGDLARTLGACLTFRPLPLTAGGVLLLTGPPGSGKTLTAARLATRLVLAGTKPLVATTDTSRAGAVEELAALTRLLGIRLVEAHDELSLARGLAARGDTPAIVDTAGADPFDATQQASIAALAASAEAQVALVLPGGLHPDEAAEYATAFARSGARFLIATRMDQSRRLGGVLAAASAGRLALAEAGVGAGVADGLVPMTPALLAHRLAMAAHSPRQENAA